MMPRRTVADHRPNTRRRRSTQDVSVFSGVHIGRMLRCSELTGGVYHNRITSFSCCKVTESPRCSCRHPFLRKHSWHLVCLIVCFPCFLRLLYSSIAGLCPISRKLSKTQWKPTSMQGFLRDVKVPNAASHGDAHTLTAPLVIVVNQ